MVTRRSFSFGWKKKKPKTEEVKPDPSQEIAMKIIDKELELERNCTAKVVHELVAAYTSAIEHYSSINDPKFMDFQKRMHKTLMKPEVVKALKQENITRPERKSLPSALSPSDIFKSPASSPQKPVIIPLRSPKKTQTCIETSSQSVKKLLENYSPTKISSPVLNFSQTTVAGSPSPDKTLSLAARMAMRREQMNLNKDVQQLIPFGQQPSNGKNTSLIMDRTTKALKVTAVRAAADIKSQNSALEKRLETRKKVKLSKSMSYASYSGPDSPDTFKVDISDIDENEGSTRSSWFMTEEHNEENADKYEKILEGIMEKNFAERAAKVSEIRTRYEAQIKEYGSMGPVMQMLVQKMKNDMQDEISKTIQEFDAKRKESIARLKESSVKIN